MLRCSPTAPRPSRPSAGVRGVCVRHSVRPSPALPSIHPCLIHAYIHIFIYSHTHARTHNHLNAAGVDVDRLRDLALEPLLEVRAAREQSTVTRGKRARGLPRQTSPNPRPPNAKEDRNPTGRRVSIRRAARCTQATRRPPHNYARPRRAESAAPPAARRTHFTSRPPNHTPPRSLHAPPAAPRRTPRPNRPPHSRATPSPIDRAVPCAARHTAPVPCRAAPRRVSVRRRPLHPIHNSWGGVSPVGVGGAFRGGPPAKLCAWGVKMRGWAGGGGRAQTPQSFTLRGPLKLPTPSPQGAVCVWGQWVFRGRREGGGGGEE
jgi:hypothetical protein